ncbi:MAG: sulfotransferase domain-containing protein [Candidatus Thermoplasmatota archaeon]
MDIVIHVGLHRTGTTFLQREVFPKMKNINFLPNIKNKSFMIYGKLSEDKTNVISDEHFSGHPFKPHRFEDRFTISRRLYNLYPNARIIVVFRNKKSWVRSLYNQYIKKVRKKNGLTFDEWSEEVFDERSLCFEQYEKYLKKLFQNVLVLRYEELKDNPNCFVKKICKFIGTSVPAYNNIKINKGKNIETMNKIQILHKILGKLKIPDSIQKLFRNLVLKIN